MAVITAKDGSAISYSDHGDGRPLLFLHGWMMSGKVWHFQLPLAGDFRLITLDLRGHGDSDAGDFSYAACLGDMEELLDHLGISGITVVGWSLGAQLALKAYAAPTLRSRIAGLVLVGGTPRFCLGDGYHCGLPSDEARGMALRLKRDYRQTSGQFFKSMFAADELPPGKLVDIAAKTVGKLPPPPIALAALQELASADLRRLLPTTDVPVLLVHGARDTICPSAAAEYMAGQLPKALLKLFPSAGHAPFLSAPELFNAELAGFIGSIHGGN